LSCNLQLHFESICDWPNYWSVQSLPRHPTSSVSCHVLLMWRRSWGVRCGGFSVIDCHWLSIDCHLAFWWLMLTVEGVVHWPGLLTKRRKRDRVWSCNLQLHCWSVCDWHVYCSVQSWKTTSLTPNFVCVMSHCLSWVAHVELEEITRQSLIRQITTAL